MITGMAADKEGKVFFGCAGKGTYSTKDNGQTLTKLLQENFQVY